VEHSHRRQGRRSPRLGGRGPVAVDGIDLLLPNFWNLVWPGDAGPVADPADFAADRDEDVNPGSCGLWGDEAAQLIPRDELIPTVDQAQATCPSPDRPGDRSR